MQVLNDARGRWSKVAQAATQQTERGAHYAFKQADALRRERVSLTVVAGALGVGFATALAAANSRRAAAATSTAFQGDWYETLKSEHRRIDRLFKSILATADAQVAKRERLLEVLDEALTRHSLEEEHVVYPALRDADQGAMSTHLAAEHFDMKTYLHELDAGEKDDPKWIGKVRAFHALVREHVREEEEVVFPPFRERLSASDNAALTRAVHRQGLRLA